MAFSEALAYHNLVNPLQVEDLRYTTILVYMIMTTLAGGLLLLLVTDVICGVCNENTIERRIASEVEMIRTLQEIQRSSLQNVCYSLLFDFNATIELNLNQTFTISSNVSLQGSNTTVKCNTFSHNYNHTGIISVNNVKHFSITGVSFITCPSTLVRFENVSDTTIMECHFV